MHIDTYSSFLLIFNLITFDWFQHFFFFLNKYLVVCSTIAFHWLLKESAEKPLMNVYDDNDVLLGVCWGGGGNCTCVSLVRSHRLFKLLAFPLYPDPLNAPTHPPRSAKKIYRSEGMYFDWVYCSIWSFIYHFNWMEMWFLILLFDFIIYLLLI